MSGRWKDGGNELLTGGGGQRVINPVRMCIVHVQGWLLFRRRSCKQDGVNSRRRMQSCWMLGDRDCWTPAQGSALRWMDQSMTSHLDGLPAFSRDYAGKTADDLFMNWLWSRCRARLSNPWASVLGLDGDFGHVHNIRIESGITTWEFDVCLVYQQ